MRLIRRRPSTAFANIFYTNFFAAGSLPPPPSGTPPPRAANSAAWTKSSALAASAAPGYSGQRTSPLIFAPESSYCPASYLQTPIQVRRATVQHRRHGGVNGRGKGRGQGL